MAKPPKHSTIPSSDTLLDLDTQIQRKTIRIDGTPYELRNLSEFSLMDRHEMASIGKALQAGWKVIGSEDDGTTQQIIRAAASLDEAFQRVVIDAKGVTAKLSVEQKLAVLNCFFEQAASQANPVKANGTPPSGLLPASSDSTEEPPANG